MVGSSSSDEEILTSTNSGDSEDMGPPLSSNATSNDSPSHNTRLAYGIGWRDQEDIVISGISCRLPQSDNMAQLADNLYSATDMVTEDNSRWEPGLYGNPRRTGKVRTWAKFDAQFFGIPPKQVACMDPQLRNLLHAAYEAICDAGLAPASIRGSRTGVFVGSSGSESIAALTRDPETVTGYSMSGCASSMFANRLSFNLDLRGPSFNVDTACNSSLLALQVALTAMRDGQCDMALVCGANATLTATNCLQFTRLGVLAPDGACRSFDADGAGYCKSEGIGAMLLQRSSEAYRNYATLIHAKSSTDGWKEEGVHFPSGSCQGQLLREVYDECGVSPASVGYVEAHGTGTKVGDPQEVNTIADVFCPGRTEPLKIGSIKSNMGHAEPASGVASIAKVVLAMERGVIPPNLHYKTPNPAIPSLTDGRISVCDKPTPWDGGYVGVNSFGFGGANTHVLLRSNLDIRPTPPKTSLPKLLCFASRTQAGLDGVFDAVEAHADDHHFYSLLANQAQAPLNLHPHRGFLLMGKADGGGSVRAQAKVGYERRPLYLIFNGMGAQWVGMGEDLMGIETFRASILKSSEVTRQLGCDPYSLLLSTKDKDVFKNVRNSIVCNIAVQVALVDILRHLGVAWDGILGHSTGEIACAYADGALDRKQTMLLAYWRGETILSANLAPGAMAAVGMTWEEATRRLEGTDIVPACHNGADSVSVSGPVEAVHSFVTKLDAEGVFARNVDSSGIAFHSPAMSALKEGLLERFSAIIPEPKPRSSGWISSSLRPEAQESWTRLSGPEYHINNVVSPVRFHDALASLPEKAVTLEMGGHNLLGAILRRTLPAPATHIGLMSKKAPSCLDQLLEGLGKLYSAGICVQFQRLYPSVSWPVPRGTPMIGSLITWDEGTEFPVCTGSGAGTDSGGASFTYDPFAKDGDDAFLLDHNIDGRALFPFTGFPLMAWKAVAKSVGKELEETPVVFSDLRVFRPTIITKAVKFSLSLAPESGDFEVMEGDSIAASGNVKIVEEANKPFFYERLVNQEFMFDPSKDGPDSPVLKQEDLYKEFLLRGYEYGPKFRGLHAFSNDGTAGLLHWDPEVRNWITFLDALLQATITRERGESLRLPVRLRYLRIDPRRQATSVTETGDGVSVVRIRADAHTNGLLAGGVEMRDLTVQTAQRRPSSANTFAEKVIFVPFEETACFNEYPEIRRKAIDAGARVGVAVTKGLGAWVEQRPALLAQPPFGPFLEDILAELRAANFVAPAHAGDAKSLEAALCKVFAELPTLTEEPITDANILIEAGKALLTQTAGLLHQDCYWGAYAQSRAVKALTDIAVENARTHKLRLLMVEPPEAGLAKTLKAYFTAHPQIDLTTLFSAPKKPTEESEYETLEIDWSLGGRAMEEDEAFHVTLVDRVLSKATDIPRYLQAVKQSLNNEGFLLVNEVTRGFALNAATEILLGSAAEPSFDSRRRFGLYLDDAEWRAAFKEAGLVIVGAKTDPAMDTTLYLLRPLPETPFAPTIVDCDDVVDFAWVPALQGHLERLQEEPLRQTILLTSTKVLDNGMFGLVHCFREELLARNRVRGLVNVSLDPATPPLDVESAEVMERLATLDLHLSVYRDGVWGTMRSLVVGKESAGDARVDTPHAFITNRLHGDLGSFDWIQNPNDLYAHRAEKTAEDGLVSIYFSSLNFRDVMLATGRLSADAIPGDFAARECLLGSEFAGRIASGPEAGKRIMGMAPAQALATDLVIKRSMCFDIPPHWSLEEAATVPAVYNTAYYALVIRGNLKAGDTVLIHSGSGGVGQAAISVALSLGCEVFTTVSGPEKRAFLRARFPQLRERHFSNSRSTEFEFHIAAETKGRGVDVVLNSLSEDKLLASVRCLATHGRFLEIGKFDLANNSSLGMEIFLRNVQFHGILVDGLTEAADWNRLGALVNDGIRSGAVRPLPRSVFAKEKVEDAFRFMAQGKHIGKVIIKIREEESTPICPPSPIKVSAIRRAYCHPGQGYLLSGGLGGFGLQVANWLVSRGARHLTLTSRSGAKTGYQRRCIRAWEAKGVTVSISKLNIGEEAECRQLLSEMAARRPIGGIFHLAMILRDALFENQDVTNFKESAVTKYWGTKNLDQLSRSICGPELRWFVCFSSVTSGRGNQGQTNYGWSNCTMERICEQRHRAGLAGLAIQWGAIGDVGVILNNMGDNSTVVGGTLPQRMPSCLLHLDEFMGWETPIVSCFVRAEVGGGDSGGGGDIVETIARIVGVDASTLDEDAPLSDLGLDSLMGMEIKQAVERDANVVLSIKEISTLTLKKLRGLAKGGATGDLKAPAAATDVRQQLLDIFRLRIDANNCLTHDSVTPLNDVKDGPNVFFVHTMEGIADPLKDLGAQLSCPAYCLQCTPETPMESIEAMAAYYTAAMKRVQPEGPYTVVGYSYGACIAFEMGVSLEAEGQTPTVLLLDSSHHYMKTYRTIYRLVYKVGEGASLVGHPNFESELICALAMRFSAVDYAGLRTQLLAAADWAARVDVASKALQICPAVVVKDGIVKDTSVFQWIANSVRARYMAADKYTPSTKMRGDLTLVRAETGIAKEVDLGDDYGLGEVVLGNVDVVVMPGTHEDIAIANADKTAAVILSKVFPNNQ